MHKTKHDQYAFSILEIFVVLIIFSFLSGLGLYALKTSIPRRNLINQTEAVIQALEKAKLDASSKMQWTCVRYRKGQSKLQVWIDGNNNHGKVNNGCGENADFLVYEHIFADGISISNCGKPEDNSLFRNTRIIWFDRSGLPFRCSDLGCFLQDYQMFVRNDKLNKRNRTREIEISGAGLIHKVAYGEKGLNESFWARAPGMTGSGSCN